MPKTLFPLASLQKAFLTTKCLISNCFPKMSSDTKHVLITGGTGFAAAHMIDLLIKVTADQVPWLQLTCISGWQVYCDSDYTRCN